MLTCTWIYYYVLFFKYPSLMLWVNLRSIDVFYIDPLNISNGLQVDFNQYNLKWLVYTHQVIIILLGTMFIFQKWWLIYLYLVLHGFNFFKIFFINNLVLSPAYRIYISFEKGFLLNLMIRRRLAFSS